MAVSRNQAHEWQWRACSMDLTVAPTATIGYRIDYTDNRVYYLGGDSEKKSTFGISRNYQIHVGNRLYYLRHGFGRSYDSNGDLIYEGEWQDGNRHGYGKEYHNGQLVYQGQWIMDKREYVI